MWESLVSGLIGALLVFVLGLLFMAPLYRLPTISFEICYPALLSDAALDEDAASVLLKFFTEVQTFNRGLDLADEARTRGQHIGEVFDRNLLKADRIKSPDSALYETAIQLCRAHRHS